jgi:hypothetical protein
MSSLNIAVLESRWEASTNFAVKPVFDLVSHLIFGSYDAYYYERFVSARSFEDAAVSAMSHKGVRYLYVATHGSKKGLICPNGDRIARSRLRRFLLDAILSKDLRLHGLYFAACDFTSEANARFMLAEAKSGSNPVTWVCGYESEADWLESAVLDALFFYLFYYERYHSRGSERDVILSVGKELKRLASGLVRELKFGIYVRVQGDSSRVQNIVR